MLNWYNTGVTVELEDLIESGVDIWDFEYPIPRSVIEYNGKTCKVDFDRATLEKKITDHYRFRQIGQETPGRWLHYFRTRMREIMPYYVQLYEFDAKFRNIDDPLESYNLREELSQQTSANGSTTGSSSAESQSQRTGSNELTRKISDTPQGTIDNLDEYMSEATRESNGATDTGSDSGSSRSSQTSEDSGTLTSTLTRRGNIGVQPLGGEVQNIRSAFINIDRMIIDELKDLFLQMY